MFYINNTMRVMVSTSVFSNFVETWVCRTKFLLLLAAGLMLRSGSLEKIFFTVGNQHLIPVLPLLFYFPFFSFPPLQFYTLESDSQFCKKDKRMKSKQSPYVVLSCKNCFGSDASQECSSNGEDWQNFGTHRRLH